MITGNCTSAVAALHEKCPNPGRCTCECHIAARTTSTDRGHDQGPTAPVQRPHACTACPATFGDQGGLDHHTATIHAAPAEEPTVPDPITTDPFTCACGREFTMQRGLSRHQNNCDGTPPLDEPEGSFTCTCGREFTALGWYARHVAKCTAPSGSGGGVDEANRQKKATPAKTQPPAPDPDPAELDVEHVYIVDRSWEISGGTIGVSIAMATTSADARLLESLQALMAELDARSEP